MNRKTELLTVFALLAGVFFWSVNAAVSKSYINEIPPLTLSLYRWSGCLALVSVLNIGGHGKVFRYFLRHPFKITLLGFLSIGCFNTLLYLAAQTTESVNINLINTLLPPLSVLLAFVINKRKTGPLGMVGLAVAFMGTLVVVFRGNPQNLLALRWVPGDLIMVTAVLSWGLYSALLARFKIELKLIELFFLLNLTGLFLLFIAYFSLPVREHYEFEIRHLPVFLYLAVFPSVISLLCWNHGVLKFGVDKASLAMYAMPVYGMILGTWFLGESLHLFHFLGGLMILAGFCLNLFSRRRE